MLTDTSLEFHPAANLFPMLTGDEYEQLKSDIAANGQLEPIWIHPDGRILDGRNRYMACCDLGIEPKVRQWNGGGSAVGFVVSLNIHRRHLTASQRAAIALDVLPMLEEEARQRMTAGINQYSPVEIIPQGTDNGRAREAAAALFQTNGRYVQEAKTIRHSAPDLYEAVKVGALTIPQAKHELQERKRDELRANPVPLPIGVYSTIVVDPPWPMEKIEREVAPNQFAFDYPTMTLDEIANWTGATDIAADDCHLFLWTTQKYLPATFDIMKAWGFGKFYWDITLRSHSRGYKTELAKLQEGGTDIAKYYLYCWTEAKKISNWLLWDIDKMRDAGLLHKAWNEKDNGDGTKFIMIPILALQSANCVLAEHLPEPQIAIVNGQRVPMTTRVAGYTCRLC